MSTHHHPRLALLSVTNKSGLIPFAQGLVSQGFALLSTGGTARLLRDAGLAVTDVASYTGSPEILGGRVKTLHPKVHGAILFDRHDPSHVAEAERQGIGAIDLVVANLYDFRGEAVSRHLSVEDAIHHIDIGGPAMIRAAAKNWLHTCPVIDPADYDGVLRALSAGGLDRDFRRRLAAKAFAAVSAYDAMIAAYIGSSTSHGDEPKPLPTTLPTTLTKVQDLRYGENPHQQAALYAAPELLGDVGFAQPEILNGKELSYNNILDLDAAVGLVTEFTQPAAVIIKHTNPCGVAEAQSSDEPLAAVFRRALASDPKSAFGGIVAFNRPVDSAAAEAVTSLFTECIAAPDFSEDALAILRRKPNLRVLRAPYVAAKAAGLGVRSVRGALLVQQVDGLARPSQDWEVVTKAKPTAAALRDLEFAVKVAKHVKSNAIVFAKDLTTVGIGAGQMSRVDSATIAVAKAKEEGRDVRGSVLASDAFFPFGDTVQFAAAHGVVAIAQPGGSKRDEESIRGADEHGLAMAFTGERHFRH